MKDSTHLTRHHTLTFLINGAFAFFVEAKEVGAKMLRYAEQLGMYFDKEPKVKLGILTNGIEWQFSTDLENMNVMDKKPFLTWNVLKDESVPLDFLTLLQKSQFRQQLIRTFAERKYHQSLLMDKLTALLKPSPEFIKLAIQKIETRYITERVLEEWKPILESAIQEWAKQCTLSGVLSPSVVSPATTKLPGSRKKRVGKTCPSCSAFVGPRTKRCKCGHIFVRKTAVQSSQINQGEG